MNADVEMNHVEMGRRKWHTGSCKGASSFLTSSALCLGW